MGRQKLSEAEKEAQRKKKEIRKKELRAQMEADRQEARASRAGESMFAWACRTFRVVTVGTTLILGGMEARRCMAEGVENIAERVSFVALGAWMVFGLVWAGAALLEALSLRKKGVENARAFRAYRNNIVAYLMGLLVLLFVRQLL